MATYEAFKAAFKGDIVTPSDPDYDNAIARWAANTTKRAKYVAFVKDVEDIKLALDFVKAENLPLSVKGGGRNPDGASSSEGGLVIDLSKHLAGVRIDPEKNLGYVGGGAIWETVDKAAIEHGLAAVGGKVNHIGVGGFTLGGGCGWLSGEHGLAVDNLVQATVVTADGSVLTANEKTNSDLFWAIRGGGGNFGVVTEFVFKLHDQRKTVYAGILVFPLHTLKDLVQVTNEWLQRGPSPKEGILQVFTRGPPPDKPLCVVYYVFYNGSEQEGREVYKPFLDLKPFDETSEIPYEKLNTLQNRFVQPGQNILTKTAFLSSLQPDDAEALLIKLGDLTSDDAFRLTTVIEHFSVDKINSIPNDATAFNTRSSRKIALTTCSWITNTPENQGFAKEKVLAIAHLISSFSSNSPAGAGKKRASGNNSDESVIPDRSALLYGSNYPRLRELKREYDPNFLFKGWFPIAPA